MWSHCCNWTPEAKQMWEKRWKFGKTIFRGRITFSTTDSAANRFLSENYTLQKHSQGHTRLLHNKQYALTFFSCWYGCWCVVVHPQNRGAQTCVKNFLWNNSKAAYQTSALSDKNMQNQIHRPSIHLSLWYSIKLIVFFGNTGQCLLLLLFPAFSTKSDEVYETYFWEVILFGLFHL